MWLAEASTPLPSILEGRGRQPFMSSGARDNELILRQNIPHCVYTGNLLLMNRLKF